MCNNADYDYSLIGGPNCSEGKYSYTAITKDSSGNSVSNVFSGTFSGKLANCLDGPAIRGIPDYPKKSDGFPRFQSNFVSETGVNATWEIASPVSQNRYYSTIIANGFNYEFLFRGAGAKIFTNYPESISPTYGVGSSTNAYPTNPWYLFTCYDAGKEIVNQIRLSIFKFNTVSEFDIWGSSLGAVGASSANPHIQGNEGTSCDKYSSEEKCEDRLDWDELGNTFPEEIKTSNVLLKSDKQEYHNPVFQFRTFPYDFILINWDHEGESKSFMFQ